MALGAGAQCAGAVEYAPLDRPGPAFSVPAADLAGSLVCTDDVRNATREPVLLVPATTVDSRENFSWNYEPALQAQHIPHCTTDQHGDLAKNMGDMQTRGEYLVYAIRKMHELAGRRIAIVGHSQGGMIMRWALRFWPDTRAMVEDVVGMAGTNHGSTAINTICLPGCSASLYQQSADSNWTAALNSGQETFSGIDYTEIYSHTDEFVQPNTTPFGTSSLHGPGAIANVALQDICPGDLNEHLFIGTVDTAAWALVLDAVTHSGPAVPARIDRAVCNQPLMPGFDPVTGPASLAEAAAQVVRQLSLATHAPGEPALRCYVLASCHATSAGTPAPVARRMTVSVSPRSLRHGHTTTITIRARTLGSAGRPVDARVAALGRQARLGSDGRGVLRLHPVRSGRRTLTVTAAGYRTVRIILMVR